MLKLSHFSGQSELGPTAVPLFGPADSEFEKHASATILSEVNNYISNLTPDAGSQYVLVNAMGAGEYYGCFPAGTLVETAKGEKLIEEIEPGEQVLTHRNRFRPITARTLKQAEELCDLYVQGLPSNVPSLTATPNHELFVVVREEFIQMKRKYTWEVEDPKDSLAIRRAKALIEMEFDWVPISELRRGDMIAEPFPLDEDSAALGDEKWNCPEVAYLMGLYAAEGCLAYRYGEKRYDKIRNGQLERPISSIVYVISLKEQEVAQRAADAAAKCGHLLTVTEKPDTNSITMMLSFQELGELCLDHIGSGAREKNLSSAILRMPRGWQEEFFNAYAVGDGCVRGAGKEEGTLRCVSASAALLRGVRLLLARQGLAASISGRHNKKATWYSGKPIYELSVSGGQLRGNSTSKSYVHPDGYILSSVKRVEQYDWYGEVFDLTVEEDSSFVASGIAVHNSNINGDHFPEAGLIHRPDDWQGNPAVDVAKAKRWSYGYPTFYQAYPYAHHQNKDASRAYGEVELAAWNPNMKRVELVVRVDKDKCLQFGGIGVWDKLKSGSYADVSMGTKVPYDTCSICLDWDLYHKALQTYDPKKHKHPGAAVLVYHKNIKAIRGLSVTRKDYCDHARTMMNRIFPDGRKVFVYNDFPRFFDISFVFIGADKTAKVMLFIYQGGQVYSAKSSSEVADKLGVKESSVEDFSLEKAASASEEILKSAFMGKRAKDKRGEIEKRIVPSQFAGKAVPILTRNESDLPPEVLKLMGKLPLAGTLATTAAMGIVLKPREFQKVTLHQLGKGKLADELEEKGKVFPKTDDSEEMCMGSGDFLPSLAKLLLPFLALRSALGPIIEQRVVALQSSEEKKKEAASHNTVLLRKISNAYNGYRSKAMEVLASSPQLLHSAEPIEGELHKLGSAQLEDLFTPLTVRYFQDAYFDELPFGDIAYPVVKNRSQQAYSPAWRGASPQ